MQHDTGLLTGNYLIHLATCKMLLKYLAGVRSCNIQRFVQIIGNLQI